MGGQSETRCMTRRQKAMRRALAQLRQGAELEWV